MSCENLVIPKPPITACTSDLFGIPYQQTGRTVGGTTYPVSGIVLHCYNGTIADMCNDSKCRTRSSVITGSVENSFHYGIGSPSSSGYIRQFVNEGDISWTWNTYKNNVYPTVPPAAMAFSWPTLQALHGINTTPDVYTIDIGLAIGHIVEATQRGGCYTCPTSSSLEQSQHDMLVQLLAYLVQEYDIPVDSEHITFHDFINCTEDRECVDCIDLETLLAEILAYCPPCLGEEAAPQPIAAPTDEIIYMQGVTEPCCPSSFGCEVMVPWNECFVGDLAVDGTLDNYLLGLTQDPQTGQFCLTRGCLATLPPLTGCGTTDDPLQLDLCAFGNWIPDEQAPNVINLVGLDASGCLVEASAESIVELHETPITVVDTLTICLTASGQANHTLQADVNISANPANMITVEPDGLLVAFDCTAMSNQFPIGDPIETLFGIDAEGNCVRQGMEDVVGQIICAYPLDTDIPTSVLGQTATECPVFVELGAVVFGGLQADDTNSIDLTLTHSAGNPATLVADIIVDPAVDNTLQVTANGVYVPPIAATGSDCILVTQQGNGDFQVDVIVSSALLGTSNALTCESTGLYVPRGANANVNGPLTGNGSDGNPLDIAFDQMDAQDLCDFGSAITSGTLVELVGLDGGGCLRVQDGADVIPNFINVADTDCIDLTLNGNTISANPIIAPAQLGVPNVLICDPDGLYVPQGAGITVTDTTCIDLSMVNGVISAVPIIDPQGDNVLECRAGGLYVPPPTLTAVDTNCVNMIFNQTNGEISADLIIAGAMGGVGNEVICTGSGLYVPTGAGITVQDGNCTDLTFDVTTGILTADVLISTDADNLIECRGNGLYAALTVQDTNCIDLTLSSGTLVANPIISQDPCNSVECRSTGLYARETIVRADSDMSDLQTVVNPSGTGFDEVYFDPATQLSASITNDGCTDMIVQINFSGYTGSISMSSANPANPSTFSYAIQSDLLIDGLPARDPFRSDVLFTASDLQFNTMELDAAGQPYTTTRVLAPGATLTVEANPRYRVQLNALNINLGASRIEVDPATVSLFGVTT